MTQAADLASGKGSGDENFPVASHLVSARHRPAILAFYRFARIADDVADHPTAAPAEKLEQLARMERGLRARQAPILRARRCTGCCASAGWTSSTRWTCWKPFAAM